MSSDNKYWLSLYSIIATAILIFAFLILDYLNASDQRIADVAIKTGNVQEARCLFANDSYKYLYCINQRSDK